MPDTMRAAVFKDVRDIHIEEVANPRRARRTPIVKVTTTTICGTDSHIWRGEYPWRRGGSSATSRSASSTSSGEAVRGYRGRRPRRRRRDHAVRRLLLLPARRLPQCAGYEDPGG